MPQGELGAWPSLALGGAQNRPPRVGSGTVAGHKKHRNICKPALSETRYHAEAHRHPRGVRRVEEAEGVGAAGVRLVAPVLVRVVCGCQAETGSRRRGASATGRGGRENLGESPRKRVVDLAHADAHALRGKGGDAVLADAVRSGLFSSSMANPRESAAASLAMWSMLHGLTMLAIDDFVGPSNDVETLVDPILGALLTGIASHPPALPANVWMAPRL